jgi:hypothetical protein
MAGCRSPAPWMSLAFEPGEESGRQTVGKTGVVSSFLSAEPRYRCRLPRREGRVIGPLLQPEAVGLSPPGAGWSILVMGRLISW